MQIKVEISERKFEQLAEACPFAFINEDYEERWCTTIKINKECSIENCPFVYWIENL